MEIELRNEYKDDEEAQGLLELTKMALGGNSRDQVLARRLLLHLYDSRHFLPNVNLGETICSIKGYYSEALLDVIALAKRTNIEMYEYLHDGEKIVNALWDKEKEDGW